MKKIILFLSTFSLLGAGLVSCGETEKFELTYKSAVNELHEINYKLLSAKILDTSISESFVLFTYSSSSPGCSCWLHIKSFLEETYIPETQTLFYYIGTAELENEEEKFGIKTDFVQPTICFFNKGKLVKQYDYGHHKTLFEDSSGTFSEFRRVMNNLTFNQDKLFKFNKYESVVSEMPKKQEAVFYAFKTSCSDCKDSSSKVIFPYLKTKTSINTKIYTLDIDRYVGSTNYQTIKDALKLTDKTADFGYNTGVVPTLQYWKNGAIADACVFYNDTISKDNETGKFTITDSFYTNERKNVLSYLENVQTKVLTGLEIPSEDVDAFEVESTYYYFWKAEKAINYHKPLLDAFLTLYVK